MKRGLPLAALAAAAVGIVAALQVAPGRRGFDAGAIRARLIADTAAATGRTLSVGPLRWRLWPDLTVDADDVALSNPPGCSRPAMLTARHLRLQVALLPLLAHRVVVRDLALANADLRVEPSCAGAPNWRFSAAPPPARTAPALVGTPPVGGGQTSAPSDRVSVLGVAVDGTLSWLGPNGSGSLGVAGLTAREVNASSSITLEGTVTDAGEPVMLRGRVGGQAHLWNPRDRTAWPVDLTVAGAAGTIAVDGNLADPRHLGGFDGTIHASGPDLGRLFTPWPQLPIPRLRDLRLEASVIERADGIDVPRLTLSAGASDLSATLPGLLLDQVSIAAPNIDGTAGLQTNRIDASGRYAGQTLVVQATVGPLGRLFGAARGVTRAPIAIDASGTAAGARARVHGRLGPLGVWSATAGTFEANIPDLAGLSGLAGRSLPRWRDIALTGALGSTHGGVSATIHLSSPQGELRADGTARFGDRPRYTGTVALARLDLDGLAAALPAPPAARTPAGPGPAAAPAWPLEALRGFDADVVLTGASVVARGVTLSGVSAHARLERGRLELDPISAAIGPNGLSAHLWVDAGRAPPAVAIGLAAQNGDAGAFAALAGMPGAMSGRLDLQVGLAGTGATPLAWMATLDGHAGLALSTAQVRNEVLGRALALVSPAARPMLLSENAGTGAGNGGTDVACLAAVLDLAHGIGRLGPAYLATRRLRIAATGSIDLAQQTLDLRLRPFVVLGATGLVLPSRAVGPWQSPSLTPEAASGPARAAAGAPAGDAMLALANSPDCTPALGAARAPAARVALPAVETQAQATSRRARALAVIDRLFH